MFALNTITLLFNGLTLALALGFLLIILWNDLRQEINQFFAVFLVMVALWNAGYFLTQALLLIDNNSFLVNFTLGVMELGFTGSSIGAYALTASVTRSFHRRLRIMVFAGLVVVVVFRAVLLASGAPTSFQRLESGLLSYEAAPVLALFYLVFGGVTLLLLWQYRRKLHSRALVVGLVVFVCGQMLGFLNPALQAFSLSIMVSSAAALVVSFALLRQEVIDPLAERVAQVESMHSVSLAITSQIAVDRVLSQIAVQATEWLSANGAAIWLPKGKMLEVAAVHGLPTAFLRQHLLYGEGMVGTAAQERRSLHVDNYAREWKGVADLPLARETFGSVIATPLVYGGDVIGVLMVVAGRQEPLFRRDDIRLLELLGAQAAVAVAHGHLFAEQGKLTEAVEAARNQLETVLASTENPVIAVDRRLRLIFANPAASALFEHPNMESGEALASLVPPALQSTLESMMAAMRRERSGVFEVAIGNQVYMCHVARFGTPRVGGWAAVLNDVTQLMELDRLKSEMVRMTSHDLKNPLQAALANLDLLSEDLGTDISDDARHSIHTIERQLERMHRIIRGILDLERVRAGKTATEPCEAGMLINAVVDDLRELADERGISLTGSSDKALSFSGDPDQFHQALTNVVENAIKFTPAGGFVRVGAQSDGTCIVFRVEDTGVGIPAELQAHVFERFYRGKQQGVEHVSGSGLGLSFVKTIVENHSGKVWLESQPGQGTIFYISVPAHRIQTPPVS